MVTGLCQISRICETDNGNGDNGDDDINDDDDNGDNGDNGDDDDDDISGDDNGEDYNTLKWIGYRRSRIVWLSNYK